MDAIDQQTNSGAKWAGGGRHHRQVEEGQAQRGCQAREGLRNHI